MYIKHIQTISNNYLTSRTFPCLSNPCDRPQRSHSQTCRFSQWVQVHLKVLVACPKICRVSGHDKKHGLRRMGHTVKMQAERLADFKIQRLVMLEKMSSCCIMLGVPWIWNIGNASAFNAIQKIGNMRWKLIKWALAAWARNIQPLLGALSKHCFPIKRQTHWPLKDSKPD